jgi:hypothetical protein
VRDLRTIASRLALEVEGNSERAKAAREGFAGLALVLGSKTRWTGLAAENLWPVRRLLARSCSTLSPRFL